MNYNNMCHNCFSEKTVSEGPCPKCGYIYTPKSANLNCLTPGTLLHNRYIIGVPLGVGGFGITYKCFDTSIGGICAVKEYFPTNFAMRNGATKDVIVSEANLERYSKIKRRFEEEARLVRNLNHRNIIRIIDSFSENNTAYYVMEYCDGVDLRRYTNNFSKKLGYAEGMNLLYQIMNGLEYIHSKGILHRDIAPDNIYVTRNNTIKILDFGSARSEMEQLNRELSVIVKVGYAPVEQYGGRGKQGPYTDIYALGATFYHLFTSKIPIESTQRVVDDNLIPFSQLRPDLPGNLKYCIERAMELTTAARISNIAEMRSILGLSNGMVRKDKKSRAKSPFLKLHQKQYRSGQLAKPPANRPPINRPPINRPPVNQHVNKPPVNPPGGGQQLNGQPANRPPVNRPPMNRPPANRPPANIPKFVRASLGMRFGAYFLDVAIWMMIYFIMLAGALRDNEEFFIGVGCLFPVVFTLINIILELTSSTTLGKSLLHLYVCDKTGAEITASQALIRNIVKLLGVFTVAFGAKDSLLHDRVTGSIVCIKK